MIIDIEKLRAIPELLKTKSRKEIAKDFGVAVSTISDAIGTGKQTLKLVQLQDPV